MLDFLLDIIFPRYCVGCKKFGKYFCNDCLKTIRFYSPLISVNYKKIPNVDELYVLAHYDGIIRKAIKEVKYRGKYHIFCEIAPLISPNFDFDYLIPVPLSEKRLQTRGFNQAEKLASYINKNKILNCLVRTRDTRPQFNLKLHEREENVKNVFSCRYPLTANFYCLVDDVATTGSTLSECAKVLKNSGASKVYAICIARGN